MKFANRKSVEYWWNINLLVQTWKSCIAREAVMRFWATEDDLDHIVAVLSSYLKQCCLCFCLLHLILPLWASVFIDFIFWDLSYDMQSIISLSLLLPRSTKLQLNWTQLTLTLFLSIHPTTYPSMFSKLIITTQKQIEIHV